MDILRKPVDNASSPAFPFLPFDNLPADVPVEHDQFAIDRAHRLGLRLSDANLQRFDKLGVVRREPELNCGVRLPFTSHPVTHFQLSKELDRSTVAVKRNGLPLIEAQVLAILPIVRLIERLRFRPRFERWNHHDPQGVLIQQAELDWPTCPAAGVASIQGSRQQHVLRANQNRRTLRMQEPFSGINAPCDRATSQTAMTLVLPKPVGMSSDARLPMPLRNLASSSSCQGSGDSFSFNPVLVSGCSCRDLPLI